MASYVYGPGGLPLEQVQASGPVYYYHSDRLGSVRALTNDAASPSVQNTYSYDPYGTVTASTGSVYNPFGYAGEYTDAESGFLYLRARYYDPATQQFLTVDPLLAVTGQAYNYTGGSPLNGTDPTGLANASPNFGDPPTALGKSCVGLWCILAQAQVAYVWLSQQIDDATGTVCPSVGLLDYNQALAEALKKSGLDRINPKDTIPNKARFGSSEFNGRKTVDGEQGFRVEYDERSGAHINWWDTRVGKGPAFRGHIQFEGTARTVQQILKWFNIGSKGQPDGLELPDIELPDIALPDITLPDIGIPDLPQWLICQRHLERSEEDLPTMPTAP